MGSNSNALHQRLNTVQKNAVEKAARILEEDGRCLIVMPTGTGKTQVGIKIIQHFHAHKILWITQTDELIFQTIEDLKQGLKMDVGLIRRAKRSVEEQVIVASLQTLQNEAYLKTIPRGLFDLIIVDEAHHSRAVTWEKTINYFSSRKLGLTATPIRNDGLGLEDIFGSSAFRMTYQEARDLKLIAEETYRLVLTNSILNGVITSRGDYKPNELDRLVISENRNKIVVKSYLKYGRPFLDKMNIPRKTLCFCISVRHAVRMRDLFRKAGIKAEILISRSHTGKLRYGKRESIQTSLERKQTFEAFKSSKSGLEILCCINVLNEGKNVPEVACILMTRPTRSNTIFQQQIGRPCRRIEGKKEKFLILDYVDQMANQDYPPLSLARVQGRKLKPEEIVLDYYRGHDTLAVDKIIEFLSPDHPFFPGPMWTKEKISQALLEYYKKHQKISFKDLRTSQTGLPNRTTIRRYWPTVSACFKELGIKTRSMRSWTKEEIREKLLAYYKEKGRIAITDLGSKNDLPSQKSIQKYWGKWTNFEKENGLGQKKWTRRAAIKAIRYFHKKEGRYPKHSEFYLKNSAKYNLPSHWTVLNLFGDVRTAFEKAGQIRKKRSDLPKWIWGNKSSINPFRVEYWHKQKRYAVGVFPTLKDAEIALKKARAAHGLG